MISIRKYYKLAGILPFGIIAGIGLVLAITHNSRHYKSEWFVDDGFLMTIFLTILLSAFISVLSLTILLCKKNSVRSNAILSFLSWVPAPGTLCVFVIYEEYLNFAGKSAIDGGYDGSRLLDSYILFTGVMHLAGVMGTYLHFIIFNRRSKVRAVPN